MEGRRGGGGKEGFVDSLPGSRTGCAHWAGEAPRPSKAAKKREALLGGGEERRRPAALVPRPGPPAFPSAPPGSHRLPHGDILCAPLSSRDGHLFPAGFGCFIPRSPLSVARGRGGGYGLYARRPSCMASPSFSRHGLKLSCSSGGRAWPPAPSSGQLLSASRGWLAAGRGCEWRGEGEMATCFGAGRPADGKVRKPAARGGVICRARGYPTECRRGWERRRPCGLEGGCGVDAWGVP